MEPPREEYRHGDSGQEIVELQQRLLDHGVHPGPTDGHFGDDMKAAVVRFQSMMGIPPDGVIGPQTLARLRGEVSRDPFLDDLTMTTKTAETLRRDTAQQAPPEERSREESFAQDNAAQDNAAQDNAAQDNFQANLKNQKIEFDPRQQSAPGDPRLDNSAPDLSELDASGISDGFDEVTAGFESSIRLAAARQAGFRGEKDEDRRDLLDFTADIHALGQVVASRNVDPPLSIGLFGDWGVGKSFFMDKMKKRIVALAKSARASEEERLAGRPVSEPEYWSDIAQIDFNAWHYVDRNLWASLVVRIFDGLAHHISEKEDVKSEQTEEVFAAKQEQLRRQELLLAEKRSELEAVRERIQETEPARAPLLAWLQIVAEDGELRKALEKSGLAPHLENIVVLNRYMTDMTSSWGRIRAQIDALFTGPYRWRLLGIGVGIAAAGALLGKVLSLVDGEAIWPSVVQYGGSIIAAAGALQHYAKKVNKGLEWFQQNLGLLVTRRDEMRAKLDAAWQEEQKRAGSLRAEEKELLDEIAAARTRIDEIRQEFADLEVDTDMLRFVEERAGSTEYQEQLGIVASIRRDFEQLSRMLTRASNRRRALWKLPVDEYAAAMTKLAKEEDEEVAATQGADASSDDVTPRAVAAATAAASSAALAPTAAPSPDAPSDTPPDAASAPHGTNRLRRIDRIVLYIDDLDRCPPERVVEVLQAVHLLLYFELFVVVVAVDSRWLLLSLEKHYPDFLKLDRELAGNGDQQLERGASTPQNYLEKIFQVALNIRRMGKTGFGNLVEVLLAPAEERRDAAEAEAQADKKAAAAREKASTVDGATDEGTLVMPANTGGIDDGFGDGTGQRASEAASEVTSEAAAKAAADAAQDEAPVNANPPHLQITDHERGFLKLLYGLIDTPRAASRLTNTYRLFRATVREQELHHFVRPRARGYRAVLLMLALLIGRPYLARFVLRHVDDTDSLDSWGDVVEGLEPTREENVVEGEVRVNHRNRVSPRITRADADRWRVLQLVLRRIPETDDLRLGDLQRWVRRVTRYAVHPYRFERPDEYQREQWRRMRAMGRRPAPEEAGPGPEQEDKAGAS